MKTETGSNESNKRKERGKKFKTRRSDSKCDCWGESGGSGRAEKN